MKERLHMRRLVLLTTVVLAGCGTFQLAGTIASTTAKTNDQQRLDLLQCKDRARLEANSAERQAGAFALGLTVVGAPLAYELEKRKQREVFATCMSELGYAVTPVTDERATAKFLPAPVPIPAQAINAAVSTAPPPITTLPVAVPQPVPAPPIAPSLPLSAAPATAPKDITAQLQKLQELRDRGLITVQEFETKRKALLDAL